MVEHINAEVISIGTEILLGELTDTNSVYIARALRDLGINLFYMTSVGDNEQRIASSITRAFTRADVVITCGGLGPTVDDMTRSAVAKATDRKLVFHQTLLDKITERFARFRVNMTENNRRQAYLPEGAIAIENPVGTAPAFIVEYDGKAVISLPGVPREMKYLMVERIIPYLKSRYQLGIIKARILKTAGVGESALDELIGNELLGQANPSIGLAAHSGQIDIRITAKAQSVQEADVLISDVESSLKARVGKFIFGADTDQLEDAIISLLKQLSGRLVVVEAGFTSNIVEILLKDSKNLSNHLSSYYFASSSDLKAAISLKKSVQHHELAQYTAEYYFAQTSDALAVISVVSDPDVGEGDDHSEVTVVHVYRPGDTRQRSYGFGGQYEMAQNWVRSWALANTWRVLNEVNLNAK